MEKFNISVLDNVFESEENSMSHMALLGLGKTELLKQIVGSLLKSGKKVMWFHPNEESQSMIKKWNPYQLINQNGLNASLLISQHFIFVETLQIDFEKLKSLLIADSSEWVLVQDNIEELAWNYEQNEFVTQKIDFLYYISEFGRVFNLYTLITGKDIEKITELLPIRKIIDNSKYHFFLNQSHASLDFLKKENWLTENQIQSIPRLDRFEALFLKK